MGKRADLSRFRSLPSLDDGRRLCAYVSAQACVRLAVKLDFITALLKRSLECTGTMEFRGVQADLGEVVAWRNMFWALSDSMCSEATPWVNGAWLPDHAALQTYRVMAPMAYAKIKILSNVT